MKIPTLKTNRLTLRPFALDDAAIVQELAGAFKVAATTLTMPHPYEDGMAEAWIGSHEARWEAAAGLLLAMVTEEDGLVGTIGLELDANHQWGELGYWVGVPFWNQGYATEACAELVDWGFGVAGLNRIQARHFTGNPASGRVMQKVGMTHEGTMRQQYVRFGEFRDVAVYGILRSDHSESPG